MDADTRAFVREEVADATLSAFLATSVDDRPHVAPVWYTYEAADDGDVVSLLTGGRKLRNVRENPRVALAIERADEAAVEWRVVLRGTARVVEDPETVRAARNALFEKYYGPDYDDADTEEGGALVEVAVGSGNVEQYQEDAV
ncbi:pyridoxamine 5'-phosphate oxidase family protein [Haloglomus litoreum]|uniref:pyridoxamine 5'-phosphate oxidase family protein n=1 Tax=Haloglomus litoreum TaxID=3034026 RepID=UPI0023E82B02|nr:pyridoxamine 5'-phosphate oxidase family protein [Haloglomus sp. DT116]